MKSLSSFEYVEPSGKDMGINVRKKAANIVALLNDQDKIEEARNKAAANRDKYFGLSSSGITYKSGSASVSSSSIQSSDRYGVFSSSQYRDSYKNSYKDDGQLGEEKFEPRSTKSSRGVTNNSQGNSLSKGSTCCSSEVQVTSAPDVSKSATMIDASKKYSSVPAKSSNALSNNFEDDFDDFDPRGSSSSSKSAAGRSNQVDLFGQNLFDDLMDAPTYIQKETSAMNSNPSEVDLFTDASFVSASAYVEAGTSSETQPKVDRFTAQPSASSTVSSSSGPQVDLFAAQPPAYSTVGTSVDFFAASDRSPQPESNSSKPEPTNNNAFDPFAAVPLNTFDGSDLFGGFTSSTDSVSTKATKGPNSRQNNLSAPSSAESKPSPKSGSFQVKSGVWADSLSKGLIDLNITAPKKVSLADIGIVGGLSDGSDEGEKGPPTTTFHMGRAMGAGSGLGMTGFASSSSTGTTGDDLFSSLSGPQH